MELDPIVEQFVADTAPFVAGIEAAIEAAQNFRDELIEIQALLDALPLERTVRLNFETNGVPGSAAAGAADAAAIAAQADALQAARDAAYEDAAAQAVNAAATRQDGESARDAAAAEYMLAMAERMRANSAREAAGAAFDQSAATLASIDATLAAARASKVYDDAIKLLDGDAQDAGFATKLFANAIQNDAIPMWDSGAGRLGFLTGKVQLFGGQLTQLGVPAILATASGLHLLIDGILEVSATLLPAAVAFVSFGAAAVPTVQDIVTQMQNLHTVNMALGTSLYPLTGGFQAMAAAVQPEVYTLFGEGLDIINSKTGIFTQVVTGAGKVLDDLGARFTYAITNGNTFDTFMHNAVADLAGWGNLIGNIGGILGNVFRELPGYAGWLLSLAQGVTHVAEVATAAAGPLLQFGLAAHGALLYVGLAATGGAALMTNMLGGVATLSLDAAVRLAGLGAAGEVAAGGLLAVGGAAETAAAMPWGWILAAAAGIGVLIYNLSQAKDAAQQFNASMQNAIQNSSLQNLAATIGSAMTQTAAQVTAAGHQVTAATDQVTAATEKGRAAYLNQVLAVQSAQRTESQYQAGLNSVSSTQSLVASRMQALSKEYGGNAAAMALMNAAGITSAQITDTNNQHWAQALIEIRAQANALSAMALGAGRTGAAMNALGNQFMTDTLPAIQKVTQAEDALMNVITGAPSALDAFEQGIGTLAQNFQQVTGKGGSVNETLANLKSSASLAGAAIGGTSQASYALNQAFYQEVQNGQKLIDSLQQQSISTGNLKTVLATTAGQMLDFAGNNTAARAVVEAFINNALGPGTVSLQNLNNWVKTNSTSLQGLNGIIAQSTIQAGSLAGVLQTQLNNQFRQALLTSSGATKEIQAYANAITHNQATTAAGAGIRAQLITDLVNAGFSAQQAAKYVNGLAASIAALHDKTITITTIEKYAITGTGSGISGNNARALGAASGARVPGYGGGDIVPAMLEPGEAVVPKHLVPYIAGFLGAHHVPGFAGGGPVGYPGPLPHPQHWPPPSMGGIAALWAAELWKDDLHRYGAHSPVTLAEMAALWGGAAPGHGLPRTALGALLAHDEHARMGRYRTGDTEYWRAAARLASAEHAALPASERARARALAGPSYYGYKWPDTPHGLAEALAYIRHQDAETLVRDRRAVEELLKGLGYARGGLAFGSYDKGGYLPPGLSMAYNGTGRPEPVGGGSPAVPVRLHNVIQIDGRAVAEQITEHLVATVNDYGYLNSGRPTGTLLPGG